MRSLSGPDNGPEARQGRMRGLQDHYDAVSPPDAVEAAIRHDLQHRYVDPVVRECRLELMLGGLAQAAVHDDSFDNLPSNVVRFPVERTQPPIGPEPRAA